MIDISEALIKRNCLSPETFKRGEKYFESNKVRSLNYNREHKCFQAIVDGSDFYEVRIFVNSNGTVRYGDCDCPAHYNYTGYCKHIVATLLKINSQRDNFDLRKENTKKVLEHMLNLVNSQPSKSLEKIELTLEPTLTWHKTFNNEGWLMTISLKVGDKKAYVVKNMEEFIEAVKNKETLVFGKNFTYDPYQHFFTPEDKEILNIIQDIYELNKSISEKFGYYTSTDKLIKGKEVILSPSMVNKLLTILQKRFFSVDINGQKWDKVEVWEEELDLTFNLTKKDKELFLKVNILENLTPLSDDGELIFYSGKIFRLSEEYRKNFLPFYYGLVEVGPSIMLPEEYQERFLSELYPSLKKLGPVKIDENVEKILYQTPLKTEIYLDEFEENLMIDVKFIYGEYVLKAIDYNQKTISSKEKLLVRDTEQERKIIDYLEEAEFKYNGQHLYLDDEEKIFSFAYNILPRLQQEAEIFFSQRFKNVQIKPLDHFKGQVRINPGSDLLEIGFELEGVSHDELAQIYSYLKEKRKYYRLKDGSFLPLDSEPLLEFAELVNNLGLKEKDLKQELITLPKYHALLIDQLAKEKKLTAFRKDKAFKKLTEDLNNPLDTEFEVPEALKPIMRDYQKFGFKWLKTLAYYGFGGILADDMGLGKTLQAISFIASERKENNNPVLVVAPTSVIYNWQLEINTYTPDLKVKVIAGTKEERIQAIEEINNFDVFVTSYSLLRRDISNYKDINFSSLILDEAQYIKNPNSLTAKAAKIIQTKNSFALTGTPMENTITELWSIFDCLMPGYLSSYQKFINNYSKSIEKEEDVQSSQDLAKKVSPFILRRLKKDVLKELPDKIENKLVSELTKEQKKIYLAYLEKIRGEIAAEISQQGFDKMRLKVLAGLTRLRQICCHPGLFLEDYKGDSGKLEQLLEITKDILAGNHRILIFSQFTEMLKMIGQALTKEQLDYFYLDGSTESKSRLEMTQAFNQGEKSIFLISLKAGGTGLNLTGADTVIHFDLWWNPAVEDQASDRAHRFGQKKVVHVIKMISLGTIEEKIYKLQQKKKELIDRVIKPGESIISAFSEAEIRSLLEI